MNYCKRGSEGYLYLEDGTIIEGCLFGFKSKAFGEVVFSTSMTGYVESLTDPSFRGQILVLTHPLVGNYGVPNKESINGILTNYESENIQISGLVVSEETEPFKWNSIKSLNEWLLEERIPGLSNVDTRYIVKKVREKGVMSGAIIPYSDFNGKMMNYDEIDFTEYTSPKNVIVHNNKINKNVVVIDCGIKHGILYSLYIKTGYNIVRVPCKSDINEILKYDPIGIVISNGPGNPNLLDKPISTFNKIIEYRIPVLGICLGHQIITLSLGGKIRKMKYGHRAVNKPVIDLENNRCYITTHNHGYAIISKNDVPELTKIWFINPDDGTIEGLIHEKLPIITTQFHPEARPGPLDTSFVFDKFNSLINRWNHG